MPGRLFGSSHICTPRKPTLLGVKERQATAGGGARRGASAGVKVLAPRNPWLQPVDREHGQSRGEHGAKQLFRRP
jgi:hypothetical protein